MFRSPHDQPSGGQSSPGDMTDLQSLLERIDLEGSKNDSAAVEEVAESLRARLNIRVEDEAIFKSLASQLLGVTISSMPEANGDQNPATNLTNTTAAGSSPSKPSAALNEPEIQKTWSAGSSSTDNTQSDARNTAGIQRFVASSSTLSPASLDQQSSNEADEQGRGRSPIRETLHERRTPVPTPDVSRGGGNNRPPTSDSKLMRGGGSNSASRRSPSPFRFGSIFSRKGKDDGAAAAAYSPVGEVPLQTRSFDRSVSTSGSMTPNRPPMSPFPPSSEASFGSSMPPTPHHTPNISIVGLASEMLPPMMSRASVPNEFYPGTAADDANNGNSALPHAQAAQAMDRDMISPPLRGRERARTPSRRNPKLFTPPLSRSQSLPRTARSDKWRASPLRQMSPSRFFGRFASSATKAAKEQASSRSNRDQQQQPMEEDVSSQAAVAPDVPVAPAVATDMATEPVQQEARLPKSSPLKTPASRMANSDVDCKTGKHKLRRKTAPPNAATFSAAAAAVDESCDSSLSLDGEIPVQHPFPSMFNVDLSKLSKSQQAPRNKRTGATRRNNAQPLPSQQPGASLPQAAKTPAPVNTNLGAVAPEYVLTPMDTDGGLNTSGDSFEGTAHQASSVQFSIGGAGANGGRRQVKRGSRARSNRGSLNQQSGNTAPPVSTAPSIPSGGINRQPAVPNSASQASLDHARVLVTISSMREDGRRLYSQGGYGSSISVYTDAINLHATLDPSTVPGDLMAVLLSNRAAGLLMIRAVDASIRDCVTALTLVSSNSPPHYAVANDTGTVLIAKLHTRMARALLKKGNATGAERAYTSAIETAEGAMAICEEVHKSEELERNRAILSQTIGDATLEIMDVHRFQAVLTNLAAFNLPTLQSSRGSLSDRRGYHEALSQVNNALLTAPCCTDLHEKKVALLASLRRWREVANHCERFAAANVLLDGIPSAAEDLKSMKLLPGIPSAKILTANFFGDAANEDFKINDYESAEKKLNTGASAEAVLRLPQSLSATYIRSLRLEERYPGGEAALQALCNYVQARTLSPDYDHLCAAFSWLKVEMSKHNNTKRERSRADEFFRSGEFELAAKHYGNCLNIDSEGVDSALDSGGRLHAVLHCNRAACLMALKKFDEAVVECTEALRIHSRYMKAMVRRGRCFSRQQRYAQAAAEYKRWLDFVEEAKRSPDSCASFITPCLFDGPRTVSNDDIDQVKQELEEALKLNERKESSAREEASYRQERQKFHEKFADAQRRRDPTDAQKRRDQWHNQQGSSSSRRWDSFNDGPSSKRSPRKKNTQQQSHHRTDPNRGSQSNGYGPRRGSQNNGSGSRHGSQNNGYASGAQNDAATAGTHYGVLEITRGASEADIKKAYRKLALKYHPDKNRDPAATEVFRKVKTAYEALGTPQSRRQYDAEIRWGGGRRL